MTNGSHKASAFAADEVAAAEANLKAAQERLIAARQRFMQSSGCHQDCSSDGKTSTDASMNCDDAYFAALGGSPGGAQYSDAHAPFSETGSQLPDEPRPSSRAKSFVPSKDHIAAGILAIIFGLFGIHKFYMGYTNEGFIMLGVTIVGSLATFGAIALVVQLLAVVEGLIYLIKTQNQFELDYVYGSRKWL